MGSLLKYSEKPEGKSTKLKVIQQKQIIWRLRIFVGLVKAGNDCKNLENKIRQLAYLLHRDKKKLEKVHIVIWNIKSKTWIPCLWILKIVNKMSQIGWYPSKLQKRRMQKKECKDNKFKVLKPLLGVHFQLPNSSYLVLNINIFLSTYSKRNLLKLSKLR